MQRLRFICLVGALAVVVGSVPGLFVLTQDVPFSMAGAAEPLDLNTATVMDCQTL